ncbi:uncharacterized protein LOC18435749 [Amborella trichopoda]|uniref:Uncharacterized protein n=1 Tax=Amborella trichopoda TaxID=13333 RepID=W1PIR3_AMBTC|nr:uncharacterized protein LOC18435749 [Amborella trichopoda]XP_020523808.1 uncharacterized protein LOC18435749 [Amborella trichopoda]XP_020523809.1 uncharacterized protein LOC18435749 [Amborella trichopoda]ERN07526.1 hypothetical protein AMTR_s00154p00037880 [Amborella trichopoda]|eukprot:XP_006845851.1 uncharacterized protein LOC18435749 [Amborella trichopoda]
MEAVHNHGIKNYTKTFPEAENVEEDDERVLLGQGKISSNKEDRFAESSDSSSSASSSDEDFFHLAPNELGKTVSKEEGNNRVPKSREDLELGFRGEPKMGQKVILEPSPAIPEPDCMADGHGYEGPMLSQSVHSDSVQAPGVSLLPPRPFDTQGFLSVSRQSPPIQVMYKSEYSNPSISKPETPSAEQYRIPSSVFARTKSQTPMEWSVASNESLFSIHVGNSSFSRDHVFLFGKSGELTNFSSSPPLGSPPIPFVVGSDAREVEDEHDMGIEVNTDDKEDARILHEVEPTSPDEHIGPPGKHAPSSVPHSSSISHHSNDSGTSIRSFAFPILTEGGHSTSVKKVDDDATQISRTSQKKWYSCICCCQFCF